MSLINRIFSSFSDDEEKKEENPVSMPPREELAEIKYTVTGTMVPEHELVSVRKDEGQCILTVDRGVKEGYEEWDDIPTEKRTEELSPDTWEEIVNTLFDECHIDTWKDRYHEWWTDGFYWKVILTFRDGEKRVINGYMDYPEEWDIFTDMIERLAPYPNKEEDTDEDFLF